MKSKILLLFAFGLIAISTNAQQKDYPIQPVPFTHVHVNDEFWAPKMEVNAKVTIPYILQKCKENGRIDNFLRAAKLLAGDKMTEYTFDDTDLYKVIEGASYAMQVQKNPELDLYLDSLIKIIGAAQEKDGYLYTFRTVGAKKPHEWIGDKRWVKDQDLSHELYNSGHLFEAAVAHFQSTGKKNFLNIAIKNADLLVNTFGWGKLEIYPGHQIVEIGLAKLYRVTGNKKYLDLAKFFLDVRGPKGDAYNQANEKVLKQKTAVGHAVRATYMYTGMADIAALTGDQAYLHAIDDIWDDVSLRKLYITGGIGATNNGEAFGDAYQLPNMSAYAETCAAIANVYWNNRMFLLHGDSKYIDVLERTLYNGLLSGVSLSGNKFFYPNPLASMGQHQRSAWFSCACCITNMTRFLPSVPGYVYAQNGNKLYVNLFMSNISTLTIPVAGKVKITQQTEYPWKGKIDIGIDPEKSSDFSVEIRIPGWAKQQPVPGDLYQFASHTQSVINIFVNGKKVAYTIDKGYAVLKRKWAKGDKISFELPMETQKVLANTNVKDDRGRLALQRGPLVYCLEGPDNAEGSVQNISIKKETASTTTYQPELLNGVYTINLTGSSYKKQLNTDVLLETTQPVKAIPYYAWANRGSTEMTVWIPYEANAIRAKPAPTIAALSTVSSSLNVPRMYKALNDQYEPTNSIDANFPYLHWWPKKNSTEFVAYTFDSEKTVSSSSVYWFDDAPYGGCRIPAAYKVYYQKDGAWVEVKSIKTDAIAKDKYNTITFEPVKTTALKLEVQLPADNSAGIHEWVVK
ncbi:glycoside hydrolase family 127 protein [Pedobacter frigiditerrae]|uniref:glycoside hydrolase family 127 protein n=1 Tax=Pedobacter frigiditerrae TaxID=2530452 RepID=UPI00292CD86D|nr:glycoside hydrolase family 127 protein [Pedobacter frigiditerrae]